jgi:hypothetical protein
MGFSKMLSPEIKVAIRQCVDILDAKAKETKGEADDVAVACLKGFVTLFGLY